MYLTVFKFYSLLKLKYKEVLFLSPVFAYCLSRNVSEGPPITAQIVGSTNFLFEWSLFFFPPIM